MDGANMTTTTEPLLDRKAAAAMLGIRAQTLAAWASSRRYGIPYIKVGRRAMYDPARLRLWLESRTVGLEPVPVAD